MSNASQFQEASCSYDSNVDRNDRITLKCALKLRLRIDISAHYPNCTMTKIGADQVKKLYELYEAARTRPYRHRPYNGRIE